MSFRIRKDNPDANAAEIRAFLIMHGVEVIRIDQPLDWIVANDKRVGLAEVKTEDKDAKVKRSQLKFMSETTIPVQFIRNEGEALAFALTMDGLTQHEKDRLASFLIRNQAKEWRTSVIEKVLKGERV